MILRLYWQGIICRLLSHRVISFNTHLVLLVTVPTPQILTVKEQAREELRGPQEVGSVVISLSSTLRTWDRLKKAQGNYLETTQRKHNLRVARLEPARHAAWSIPRTCYSILG